MAGYLCEMENVGLIVIGRPVETEFSSTDEIEEAAEVVEEWGEKLGLPLGLIYCGTTINWPDEFEFTPVLVGLVTFEHYGDDDEEPEAIPSDALKMRAIPADLWAALEEHGLSFEDDRDAVYLAVAGWTWASIDGASRDNLVGVSAEDDGYMEIDEELVGGGGLVMRASYC